MDEIVFISTVHQLCILILGSLFFKDTHLEALGMFMQFMHFINSCVGNLGSLRIKMVYGTAFHK